MADPDRTTCADETCELTIPDHQWGRIKADGWFEEQNGTMWCPDHRPAWYAAWRARQRAAVGETE